MKWGFIIVAVVLAIIGYYFVTADRAPENLLEYTFEEHVNAKLHIHPYLEIIVDGKPYPVPEGIGIVAGGMHVIHTHDGTGKIHVESPYPHQFYLEDFFTIWGKEFSEHCLIDECDDNKTVSVYVNGFKASSIDKIPLKDAYRIKIVYE